MKIKRHKSNAIMRKSASAAASASWFSTQHQCWQITCYFVSQH